MFMISQLRLSLAADNAESARARLALRKLIDRITILPVDGGDGRGCGPISVKIEGKVGELLNFATLSTGRVVQLGSGTEARLNHVMWEQSLVIANVNKLLQISAPKHADQVLSFLSSARAPVGASDIVQHIISVGGRDCSEHNVLRVKTAVQRCLNYLSSRNQACSDPVAGTRKLLWAIPEKRAEFWPKKQSTRYSGNFADTRSVMDILQRAAAPMSVREIASNIVAARGERARKIDSKLTARVRALLHHQRQDGVVLLLQTGKRRHLWLLANRRIDLAPDERRSSDSEGTLVAFDLLKLLSASKKPLTSPELAMLTIQVSNELPTTQNKKRALDRVRQHLRKLRESGLAREIKIPGKRFRVWVPSEHCVG